MKKTYITPNTIEVEVAQNAIMAAVSGDTIQLPVSSEPGSFGGAEAKETGFNLWEDPMPNLWED